MLIKRAIIAVCLSFLLCSSVFCQLKTESPLVKWGSWLLLQGMPSPVYFEDRNQTNSRLKFGLEWQVIPFSYSFSANKYVSRVSFFHIRPSKRFSGSAEIFFEPAVTFGDFKYADLKKFTFKTGGRIVLPLAQRGEYLAISFGGGYYRQDLKSGSISEGVTYEGAVYTLFGMVGLKFNYNQNAVSRYNFGLYLKYY